MNGQEVVETEGAGGDGEPVAVRARKMRGVGGSEGSEDPAPLPGRAPYIVVCRKASFVGLSPSTSVPDASSRERRAGSSVPSEEPVGVISQPPSGSAVLRISMNALPRSGGS